MIHVLVEESFLNRYSDTLLSVTYGVWKVSRILYSLLQNPFNYKILGGIQIWTLYGKIPGIILPKINARKTQKTF